MKKLLVGSLVAGIMCCVLYAAAAQVTLPQVQTINNGDLFQDVVNGSPQANNYYASAAQLGGFFSTGTPSRGNALVGGDATTNLFQRGTTGASVSSTTPIYGPDRWAYWSGASTALTVSRDATAGDVPAGFKYAFKMARTSGQTGILPVCMAQEVESINSYQFAGQIAELDFHAVVGANFSPAGDNITASIVYGTGQDEGVASLQAGTWTGQGNATAAVISLNGAAAGRYAAVASVPSTATEVAVQFCWTPVGTAGTNDYVAFSGIQLVRNPFLTVFANTTVGYNDALTPGFTATTFERRPAAVEALYQQRYYYQLTDSGATTVRYALGQATTTAAAVFVIPFPVTMRAAPTATASATTAFGDTATAGAVTACTGFAVVASATSTLSGAVTCTTGATMTAGGASQLVGEATSANVNFSAEL